MSLSFTFSYETAKGFKAYQDGYLKKFENGTEGEVSEGKFAFISDDGKEYALGYTADENGFQAYGAHLPTPPPVPDAILRALKYIEEHPYDKDKQ